MRGLSALSRKEGGYGWMYGTTYWAKARAAQLRKQPLCALCLEHDAIVPASVVHHIHEHDGNWELFVSSPLQSLCKVCHDSLVRSREQVGFNKGADINGAPLDPDKFDKLKAKRESQYSIPFNLRKSAIPVVVVHGCVGAGKSTYVQAMSKPGDIIIDYDDIVKGLGCARYMETPAQRKAAFKIRDNLLHSLHRCTQGTCYLTVTAPTRDERVKWYLALGRHCTLYHCDADLLTCIQRIEEDPTRDPRVRARSILGARKYFQSFVL